MSTLFRSIWLRLVPDALLAYGQNTLALAGVFFITYNKPMGPQLSHIDRVIFSVVSSLLGFAGIAFVVYLIISGYTFLSAGSNKEAAIRARKSLMNAVLGLIICVSAWIFVDLIGQFMGISGFTNFSVCIVPPC